MKLIIGLGNPGGKYARTRHNIGFDVADEIAKEWGVEWKMNPKIEALIASNELKAKSYQLKAVLLKPQTYMNRSGEALSKFLDFYKLKAKSYQLYLLHDDVDLDLGRLKIQAGGGAGGHHGVESIKNHVSSSMNHLAWKDVIRFRLGIGRPNLETRNSKPETFKSADEYKRAAFESGDFCAYRGLKDYVLTKFTRAQQPLVQELTTKAVVALKTAFNSGIDQAMNQFNTKGL